VRKTENKRCIAWQRMPSYECFFVLFARRCLSLRSTAPTCRSLYVLRRDVMMAPYMLLPRCLSGRLSVTRREARRLKASSVITQSTARKMTPPATDCRLAAGNMYARSTGFCCGWSDGLQLSIFPTISECQNQALAVSSFY